jgi:hypothetical protein
MSDTCSGGPLATNFQLDVGCTALVGKGTGGLLFLDAGPGEGGCVGTLTESRPPPSTRAHHLCGGAFLATNCASDELCVPRSAPTICVSRTGDNPCPAAYPRKKLEFGSLAEGRGCAPCTCTPAPKECSGPPRVTTRSGCDAGGAASLKTSGTCVGGALLGTLDLELPDGACTLTKDTAPTGTVVGADPVTVCCTP